MIVKKKVLPATFLDFQRKLYVFQRCIFFSNPFWKENSSKCSRGLGLGGRIIEFTLSNVILNIILCNITIVYDFACNGYISLNIC